MQVSDDLSGLSSAAAADPSERNEYRAFVANRVVTPQGERWLAKKRTKYQSKKQREAAGKTLNFNKSSPDVQAGLLESRKKEWDKWKQFNAAKIVSGKELQELLAEGHVALPMQWIETDKNAHKRTPGVVVEPLYKSRLVARGDLEDTNLRSDSPTCDVEGQNLIFSFAACHGLKIRSADITNAYFQGQDLDRILLFKQPPGGLPDPELAPDAHLLARVPIYGTRDAGRGFWKALRNSLLESGLQENRMVRALYSYQEGGDVKAMICSHVDDILWACKPEAEWIIEKAKKSFVWGKEEVGNFRYCGKDIKQDDDGTIHVNCKDTTLRIGRIQIPPKRTLTDKATEAEVTQLKSVAGSLSWVARQCRPDLSYRVSRLQTRSARATVADLKEANKVIEYAQKTAERGLTFKGGLFTWDELVSVVVTDASHANEQELCPNTGEMEPHRSQGARMQLIAPPAVLGGEFTHFHLIGFASTVLKRVCRATVQAEAYAMQAGVEAGDILRAALADLKGQLDMKDWQASSTLSIKQIWITDCKSVEQALSRPVLAKITDKRLAIEISSLRQSLWRRPGGALADPLYEDARPSETTDIVLWVDTDVMIADPMTKIMDPIKLQTALDTNEWSMRQPLESLAKKRAKQLQRRKTDAHDAGTDHAIDDPE